MKYRVFASGRGVRRPRRFGWTAVGAALLALGGTLVIPFAGAQASTKSKASSFNLAQLAVQAESEGSLTVWDSSSSILQIAQNFQRKYGIKVNAQKVSAASELTKLQALSGSTNPNVDVVLFATGPSLVAQLVNQGIVKSWVPPDLDIPTNYQNPLVFLWQPAVFFYNKAKYGNTCPITNIWQLTQPKWRGLVAMVDPTQTPEMLEWFAEMVINGRNQLAAAYKKLYGKTLKSSNAGYTFIQDLAANAPLIEPSLDNVLEAVGGPGVQNPAIGLAHGATYADGQALGYSTAMCKGIDPFDGYQYPKFVVETTDTPHPAAAELFIHYVMTGPGNSPAAAGGGQSGNLNAPRGNDGPPGLLIAERKPSNFEYLRLKSLSQDFQLQTPLTQFWLEHLAS